MINTQPEVISNTHCVGNTSHSSGYTHCYTWFKSESNPVKWVVLGPQTGFGEIALIRATVDDFGDLVPAMD